MSITKKVTYTTRKSDHSNTTVKKQIVVKKSRTSKSLFAKKVEEANALLNNAKLITKLKTSAR